MNTKYHELAGTAKIQGMLSSFVLGVSLMVRPAAFAQTAQEARRNAERGDAASQYQLARMYEDGLGVPQSYARAHKWYLKAAERHFAQAEYRLGRMYSAGLGVPQSYSEEIQWLRRAAADHHGLAQNRLGVMYERGEGVTQDPIEAYKWYTLAARGAQNVFAAANQKTLAARLTFEEIAEAERRAAPLIAQKSN